MIDNFNCLKTTGDFCTQQKLKLNPFVQALPIPPEPKPVASLDPPPNPNGDEGVPRPHQRFFEFAPVKYYEFRVRPILHQFHPDLPHSTIWGYTSEAGPGSPGPTFRERYGQPVLVRIHNDLPVTGNDGFGIPEITTHNHNHHSPSESDGFPGDFYPAGVYHDHHYPMMLAGGDGREALGTHWYHDHRADFTSQNVYKGLAGIFVAYDSIDSGNENDPSPSALRLPSGEYDVPLIFSDRTFDNTAGHQLFMDIFNFDGFLGDQLTVNGAVQPYLKVARRKYRFRMLNPGPSRFYEFAVFDPSAASDGARSFTLIANDGNLLEAPLAMRSIRIAPAERMDIVVDFSGYELGSEVYLVNIMDQINGKGPTGIMLDPAAAPRVIKFVVDRSAPDPSRVPSKMRDKPRINPSEVVTTRVFEFDSTNSGWTINNKLFDLNRVDARVKRGTAERWILRNMSADWQHPIHIHLEEHQIVRRDNAQPPTFEQGRKDVSVLLPGQEIEVVMRFRDWLGRYPIHCHNTVHEDHAMMTRWDVEP